MQELLGSERFPLRYQGKIRNLTNGGKFMESLHWGNVQWSQKSGLPAAYNSGLENPQASKLQFMRASIQTDLKKPWEQGFAKPWGLPPAPVYRGCLTQNFRTYVFPGWFGTCFGLVTTFYFHFSIREMQCLSHPYPTIIYWKQKIDFGFRD